MKVLFLIHDYTIDPLGIGYLSSALKTAGHETAIFKTSKGSPTAAVKAFNPDILAYSVTTGWHQYYLKLNRGLKKEFPGVFSIFGGPHATFFPEMIDEQGVNFIVQGEGEKSFVKLLKRLGGRNSEILKTPFTTPPDPLEQNLDNIEFPDRDLMYSYPENRNNPIKNVITSRGCPYNCPYCFNSIHRGLHKGENWVRYRTVDNVIEECLDLKKYPLKLIFFQDDCFGFNIDWLRDFSSKYSKKVNIPFHCQVRIEMINKERIILLKESGCISVTFAIESGNEDIRKKLLSRNYSNDLIIAGVALLKKYKLKFRAENMVGLPGETIDEALETLDLNIACKPDMAWVSLFQPYPKTKLGELCKSLLLSDGDPDKIGKDFFKSSPIKRDTVKEFNNLQKVFPLVVEYPILRPFVRQMIKLPETELASRLSTKFRRWRYNTRLYKVN